MAQGEHLCKRCGRCCEYKKLSITDKGVRIVRSGEQCQHWDCESKLCLVYPNRREMHSGCLTMDEAIRTGIMPQDCPYVADIKGYECKVDDYEEAGE